MDFKFYMFNWTNAQEFLQKKSRVKPHFEELGPYVFREIDEKKHQVCNDNGTVTFQRNKIWMFEESLSNRSLTDEITNLNPIVAMVASLLKYKPPFLRKLVNGFMVRLGEKLVLTKSVNALIFEGLNDTSLDIARKIKVTLPYSQFAWVYGRNNSDSYDGTFNMLTGVDNLYDMGMLKELNYSNQTNNYQGLCGSIHGSLGDFWPPLVDNTTHTVSLFIPDICTKSLIREPRTTAPVGHRVRSPSVAQNSQSRPTAPTIECDRRTQRFPACASEPC
ncbi:protein croquemort-like [Temnothorax nylanderi]|uniref:protein croquemort-like n=1 Tax=Temnothorax nylanderi TaxID=102681 RepID=UPI003A87A01C